VIGTRQQYPTKASAWLAVEASQPKPKQEALANSAAGPTVGTLVEHYRAEWMPIRFSTSRGYNSWLRNHILPRWGASLITELQARPVELWLRSLTGLEPKSHAAIRGLLRRLWDFAMWRGDLPTQRNPMELVTVKGASKRTRKPRSLAPEEFLSFLNHLEEPFRTMALIMVCFGLRISECLALRWSDVDWLHSRLSVRRSIVRQHIDETKTEYSNRELPIDPSVLAVLMSWRQTSQFAEAEDWVFASPVQLGRSPWSHPRIYQVFREAASVAGIGSVGTHTMRHTYRAWLAAVNTPLEVQRDLMRHADISMTLKYGDSVTDAMNQAASKVARLVLDEDPNSTQTARKSN
jgi:integrase